MIRLDVHQSFTRLQIKPFTCFETVWSNTPFATVLIHLLPSSHRYWCLQSGFLTSRLGSVLIRDRGEKLLVFRVLCFTPLCRSLIIQISTLHAHWPLTKMPLDIEHFDITHFNINFYIFFSDRTLWLSTLWLLKTVSLRMNVLVIEEK